MIISIQYLRGIAALMVLLNHVAWKLQQRGHHAPDWLDLGEAGVDIFFVVSGFIMCHITADRGTGAGGFMRNRFIRILPLYWTLTTLALGVFLLAPGWVNSSGGNTHILASYLLVPVQGKFLVQAGWTLSYEFYFYAVFAVGLLFGARLGSIVAALALVALAAIGLWLPAAGVPWSFLTNDLLLEFVAGIGLYAMYRRRIPGPWWVAACLVGLGIAWLVAVGRSAHPPFVSSIRALRYGVPALLICWGLVALERQVRQRTIRWLERLGDISYSLYLSHVFTVGACGLIIARAPLPERWEAPLMVVASLAAALLGAEMCYRWIELPPRRALRARLDARTRLATGLRDPAPARS